MVYGGATYLGRFGHAIFIGASGLATLGLEDIGGTYAREYGRSTHDLGVGAYI